MRALRRSQASRITRCPTPRHSMSPITSFGEYLRVVRSAESACLGSVVAPSLQRGRKESSGRPFPRYLMSGWRSVERATPGPATSEPSAQVHGSLEADKRDSMCRLKSPTCPWSTSAPLACAMWQAPRPSHEVLPRGAQQTQYLQFHQFRTSGCAADQQPRRLASGQLTKRHKHSPVRTQRPSKMVCTCGSPHRNQGILFTVRTGVDGQ